MIIKQTYGIFHLKLDEISKPKCKHSKIKHNKVIIHLSVKIFY